MVKANFENPYKVLELAAGKVQCGTPAGKRQAIGDFVFSGQPAANDTFTINGAVFTAKTAGAVANQFNIGVSETTSIDALVASIVAAQAVEVAAIAAYNALPKPAPTSPPAAYAGPAVQLSQLTASNVGGTNLHIVANAYGSAGNSITLSETSANATIASSVSIANIPSSVADFVFSGQPSNGDEFIVNGYEVTFRTAYTVPIASVLTPIGPEVLIGASETASITNLVTFLTAAAVAEAAKNAAVLAGNGVVVPPILSNLVFTNVGGTNLHVVATTGSVALIVNSATATLSGTPLSLSGGHDADNFLQYEAQALDAETKALTTYTGSVVTEWDLPAGEEGQITTYYLAASKGSNAQINGAFAGPHTKLTFTTVGQMAMLKFLGAQWAPIVNTGAFS